MFKFVFSFLVVVFSSAQLWADAGNVRFSYQKVEIGSKSDWVLVPIPSSGLTGTASKSTITKAFNILKKSKRSTYGSSSISISGSSPSSARVSVTIPAKNMPYAVIIIAETVYTLTELGVSGVSFPAYSSKILKRKDIPFAAYTLVMPLWKVLPNVKSKSIQVQLPNGDIEQSFDVIKKWSSKNPGLRSQLYSYLKSADPYTVGSVAKLLPQLRLPYVDQVLPLLKHRTTSIRKTALKVLSAKREDPQVLAAVLKVMKGDKNPKVVLAAADFLSKSKNKQYSVQMTYYLLEKGTQKQTIDAITKLGASKPNPETLNALKTKLTDKRKPVAVASVNALRKLGESKLLYTSLSDKKLKSDLKLVIATQLSLMNNPATKVQGFAYLAQTANNDIALDAIEKIGVLSPSISRKTLEGLLSHRKVKRQLEALKQLAAQGKVEALPAIAKFSKTLPRKANAAGYQIMRAQNAKVIADQAKTSNKFVQRLAYRALGEKNKSPKVFSTLKLGLKNSDAGIRGASARAIGRYANKDAEKALKGALKDRDENVRGDAAHALGYFKEGVMTDVLTKMLGDKSPAVQAGAIFALGNRGESFAWDKIKALGSSKDERVRAAVATALGNLISRSDKRGVRDVISLLSGRVSDRSKYVQEAAIVALGTFKDESAVTAIALRLNDTHEPLQLAAIRALGATKHGSATELLVNMLNDPNRRVRLATMKTLVKLGDKSAKHGVQKRIKIEKDSAVKKALQKGLKAL